MILPDGKKIKLQSEKMTKDEIEENGISVKYITTIPNEYYVHPYLTIYRIIEEEGNDHWINFHWTSLTVCDGIKFKMFCRDDITIKDCLIFDNKKFYDVIMNEENNILTIISTNWLDQYTGFTITASDTKKL